MAKFRVKLDGFNFTKHVGPDGVEHLTPVHRPGYDTRAELGDTFDVEAQDALHARAVFQGLMGINNTSRDWKVHQVLTEEQAKAKAKPAEVLVDVEDEDDAIDVKDAADAGDVLSDDLVTADLAGESAPKRGRKK